MKNYCIGIDKKIDYPISEEKLRHIFNHYKIIHSLNTQIEFDEEGLACTYDIDSDFIDFGFLKVFEMHKSRGFKKRIIGSLKRVLVFTLLHEIKHAIDKDLLGEETKTVNWVRYWEDDDYHDSIVTEKRADKFAIKELQQWGV